MILNESENWAITGGTEIPDTATVIDLIGLIVMWKALVT